MSSRFLIVATLALLSGCATCARHPVVCTAATAVVVGSVAATIAAHQHDHTVTTAPVRQWYAK